jgi:uncharacterized Zn-finger protein
LNYQAVILPMNFDVRANPLKLLLQPPRPTENHQMTNTTTPAVELDGKDLPAHCPNPAMPLWSSHPRVFLEFNQHGDAKCPYCGTTYRLKAGASAAHH